MQDETIAALSSGALPSGIAVLRISGPAARLALESLAGSVPAPRRASLRRIRDASSATIDRGIALFFEGPATVTGEDLAEIHLHGGRAVVAACLAALLRLPGLRLAEPGEFTRRAFENGRIDLTEAEGLADLLAAETEAQRVRAVADAGGALRTLYEGWMARLVRARALIEASFDFADEGDVGENVTQSVRPAIERLLADMDVHLAGAARGEILRHGYRVAIVGPPNVGKSSLLNALADRDAAIVSDIPGTTRDVIEVLLDLGGIPVRLFDTAGLRETNDPVEAIGIARAMTTRDRADLVLILSDETSDETEAAKIHVKQTHVKHGGSNEITSNSPGPQPILQVRTKSDLPQTDRFGSDTTDLTISVYTGEGLDALVSRIADFARQATGDPAALVPSRTRHREIVTDARALLVEFLVNDHPAEISAETLRRAGDRLGALTGRADVEDLLDIVFSEFCIGK